jgi:hypothetical protein
MRLSAWAMMAITLILALGHLITQTTVHFLAFKGSESLRFALSTSVALTCLFTGSLGILLYFLYLLSLLT